MITFSQTSGFLGSLDLVPIFSAVSIVVVAILSVKAVSLALRSFNSSGTFYPWDDKQELSSSSYDLARQWDNEHKQ